MSHREMVRPTPKCRSYSICLIGYLYKEAYEAVSHVVVPNLPDHEYVKPRAESKYERVDYACEEFIRAFLHVWATGHLIGHGTEEKFPQLAFNTGLIKRVSFLNSTAYNNINYIMVPVGIVRHSNCYMCRRVIEERKRLCASPGPTTSTGPTNSRKRPFVLCSKGQTARVKQYWTRH